MKLLLKTNGAYGTYWGISDSSYCWSSSLSWSMFGIRSDDWNGSWFLSIAWSECWATNKY